MKRIPVLLTQMITVLLAIIMPMVFLFTAYAGEVMQAARVESANAAQIRLRYVSSLLNQLAQTISIEASRIATSDYISNIAGIDSYDELVKTPSQIILVNRVVNRLASMQYADSSLRSIYMYVDGADYVIVSDKGAMRMLPAGTGETGFADVDWLTMYREEADARKLTLISLWRQRDIPIINETRFGALGSEERVISLIFGVSPSLSKTRGILVMNFALDAFSEVINTGATDENDSVMILDADGRVICHRDTGLVGQTLPADAPMRSMLAEGQAEGIALGEDSHGLLSLLKPSACPVYAWRQTGIGGWTLVSAYTPRSLWMGTREIVMKYVSLLIALVLLGGAVCAAAFRRIFSPISTLAEKLRGPNAVRNEFLLVSRAMDELHKTERDLQTRLERSRGGECTLYLLKLLRGTCAAEEAPIAWPHENFVALAARVDNAARMTESATREQRHYYRMRLLQAGEEAAPGMCMGVEMDDFTVGFVVNTPYAPNRALEEACALAARIQRAVAQAIPSTVSFGVGPCVDSRERLHEAYARALAALSRRMLLGKGAVIPYDEACEAQSDYDHPLDAERQLINAIAARNLPLCENAVAKLMGELAEASPDGIAQAVNRTLSAISRFMLDNRLSLNARGGIAQLFSEAAQKETLEELSEFFSRLAGDLIAAQAPRADGDGEYVARIRGYLEAHYASDIDFEKMALEIGISYSYMRRLMKEATGATLLDAMHRLRVKRAKELMAQDASLTIKTVAERAGYNNTQSFERFFKRFEGVSPGEYKNTLN